jgi:P-type Ca2+ transporter type 2C
MLWKPIMDPISSPPAHRQPDARLWHSVSSEEALDRLNTAFNRGLASDEAQHRLAQYGPNELTEAPRPGFWSRLLDQFRNFLVMILIVASVVSLLLGDFVEAVAIMAIVALNAFLGVIQESKAEESLAALKKMAAPEARVLRDGRQVTVPARELVPGDIVLLETGNYVPADVRLLEAVNLKVEEASLTGESEPVQKRSDVVLDREIPLGDRRNTAYMGTLVTYGRGRGVVIGTGMSTQIGLIAQMIQSFETEPTPLQRKLEQLGKTLGIAALAICGLVFLIGVGRFVLDPIPGVTLREQVLEMFIVAVSLAIAAVPEGLPAVVTICLALGMQRMVRRNALLRRLPAVESLGSATVICSDKTGTLTQNAMTVTQVWTPDAQLAVSGDGYTPQGEFSDGDHVFWPGELPASVNLLLQVGLLCNDAHIETSGLAEGRRSWRVVGDPTEGALVVAAAKAGYWNDDQHGDVARRAAEIPFDSERKRMTVIYDVRGTGLALHQIGLNGAGERDRRESGDGEGESKETRETGKGDGVGEYLALVKGAPDLVLELCSQIYENGQARPVTAADRQRVLDINSALGSNALRVLGAAVRPLHALPADDDLTPTQVERDLVFVGLTGMIDPPRLEVKPAIATARHAGIKTVMITGDYRNTAIAIAEQIGLLRPEAKAITGAELDAMDDASFTQVVEEIDVYARTSPQHKVRIVEALRQRGHIVAMTGDGVNDAPALKRADIGVAMGITGTDVSKETAAMVLTDDNYASIVSAVEEGRIIYSNIRKFVFFLLSCNVGEVLIIFLAALAGWPLPLTAIQLLVLNLLTDGAPALALGMEQGDPDIMDRPPRRPDEPVINREMTWRIGIQAIVDTVVVLAVFRIGLAWHPDNVYYAQTMAFTTLALSELLRAYTARSERYSVFRIGLWGNRYMQYAVAASTAILLAILYVPILDPVFNTVALGPREWLVMLPFLFTPAIAAELTKIPFRRRQEREMAALAS